MIVKKNIDGELLTVEVEGRLDTLTSRDLETELNDSLDGIKSVIFDFSKLEYISSSGLRLILKTQKQMSKSGGMKVKNVNEAVMEIFDVTGFTDFLTIE